MTVNQLEHVLNTVAPNEAPRLYQAAREDGQTLPEAMRAAVHDYLEWRRIEMSSYTPYRSE